MRNKQQSTSSRGPARAGLALAREEAKIGRRTNALFNALSMDSLLREQFVTDPALVMSDYVFGARVSDETADAANQLIYSVMSEPRLRGWIVAYSRHLAGQTPSRDDFARQFAKAVASSGDDVTTLALIRSAANERDEFVLQADLLRALITVIGGRAGSSGTEMSPGGGTEMSPGGGTEMSPGAIFSGTEMSPGGGTEMSPGAIFSGTEMSPGGGTEMSPGGGTEMSPGAIFSGTEMSPGGGTEMSPGGGTEMSPGAIFSGTEMSPGGGTEMSPGGGTEMSPGAIFSGTEMSPGGGTEMSPGGGTEMSPGALGLGRIGELQITLSALTQYATQLRRRGALASTGLESR